MGLMDLASFNSIWRGYEYCKDGNVISAEQVSEAEFKGIVQGSCNSCYEVFINIAHPRKSHCSCPHAKGRRIICKHQIALYFTAFPKEAERYYKDFVESAEAEARYQDELDEKVIAYINSLSKEELRQALYEVLYDGADWVFDKFVREHIDREW